VIRAGSGIYRDVVHFFAKFRERSTVGPSGNGRVRVDGSVAGLSFLSIPTAITGADLLRRLPTSFGRG
jgi:hypothetical protein